jgi:hypothetical protein
MGRSDKPDIIRELWKSRWNPRSKTLKNPVVTLSELQEVIQRFRQAGRTKLSDRNPANFIKDLVRKKKSFLENWPAEILAAGFTAHQLTGGGRCFEFVPVKVFAEGDPGGLETTTFLNSAKPHIIESLSLPLASRALGRTDESWLIQVGVRLRLVETHFAVVSPRTVRHIDHLQSSVKLRNSEIDALFLMVERDPDQTTRDREVIVTAEAKGRRDDIIETQIHSQVAAVFEALPEKRIVVAVAMKALSPSKVHVVEYAEVRREDLPDFSLQVANQGLYEFRPAVEGVGE